MSKCIGCGGQVDSSEVKEQFAELFHQADYLGMESLTEAEQLAVENRVCSYECLTIIQ